jgi:hypothetical protein
MVPNSKIHAQDTTFIVYNDLGLSITTDFNQSRYPNPDSGAFEVTSGIPSGGDQKQHFTLQETGDLNAFLANTLSLIPFFGVFISLYLSYYEGNKLKKILEQYNGKFTTPAERFELRKDKIN